MAIKWKFNPFTCRLDRILDIDQDVNTDSDVTFNTVTATAGFSGWGIVPLKTIVAWDKDWQGTASLDDGWLQTLGQVISDSDSTFNGATLPDIGSNDANARFLRGYTSSTGTGGNASTTHTHSVIGGTAIYYASGGNTKYAFTSASIMTTSTNVQHSPLYYDVCFIMRIK